jgi:hypothetical protein
MLTTIAMLPTWNAFALRHGLPTTEEPDAATPLPSLATSGTVDGRHVAFRYVRSVATEREVLLDPGDLATAAIGVGSGPQFQEVRRVTHVLSAATATVDGEVRVTRDPSPTLRRVASWVGAGDPEVGDADFDRRFLIAAADDGAARALLPAGLRRAIAAADVAGASFACGGGRAEWSCDAVADADAALEAALAVMLATPAPRA